MLFCNATFLRKKSQNKDVKRVVHTMRLTRTQTKNSVNGNTGINKING